MCGSDGDVIDHIPDDYGVGLRAMIAERDAKIRAKDELISDLRMKAWRLRQKIHGDDFWKKPGLSAMNIEKQFIIEKKDNEIARLNKLIDGDGTGCNHSMFSLTNLQRLCKYGADHYGCNVAQPKGSSRNV